MHWFKYRDNNPLDLSTDPSNHDSNKGVVNWQFEPYAPLLQAMKEVNANAYRLVEYLSAHPSTRDSSLSGAKLP